MSTQNTPARKSAGAFDVRNIIGTLLAIYGVVLVFMGLIGDPELAKTGGVNANLWAGIGLAVVGLAFGLWARARPILVPEGQAQAHDDGERPAGH